MTIKSQCEILAVVARSKLSEATEAWYEYYGSLPVGNNRCWAAEVHANLQRATRDTESRYAPNEVTE